LWFEVSPVKQFARPHLQNSQSKVDWRHGSSGRAQSPEFKAYPTKERKKKGNQTVKFDNCFLARIISKKIKKKKKMEKELRSFKMSASGVPQKWPFSNVSNLLCHTAQTLTALITAIHSLLVNIKHEGFHFTEL
jgi:hypothetical protein